MSTSLSVVLEKPGVLSVKRIPVPLMPSASVAVSMRACGICGSDIRYFLGENPWALHTLGRNVPSPPNMVLGHEVAGVTIEDGAERRVAILAFKSCGACPACLAGRENLCDRMEHFGHSAGWGRMEYYPGGMAERFNIWRGFAYDLPDAVSFEDATFLDGLAVAVHAVDQGRCAAGSRAAVIGLGPIGMLAGMAARAAGAETVCGCDTQPLPVRLARASGYDAAFEGGSDRLVEAFEAGKIPAADFVIDTVGTERTIADGLRVLDRSGALVLLAVHEAPVAVRPTALSGERSIATSSNNRYPDFAKAIDLLATGAVRVNHLITHRFALERARDGFDAMLRKDREDVFKVVIHP